jgi:hypothetical protein
MMLSFVALLEAVVEKGIVPLAAAASSGSMSLGGQATAGRRYAASARRQLSPPTTPKPPVPGWRELVDALERSEKESVLFNADLGPLTVSNRSVFNANFSAALKKQMEEKAIKDKRDPSENIRLVDDALSCVENMDFLGQRSKKFINNRDLNDPKNNTFTTMPIKFEFASKASRVNFERTLRDCCGARAIQSFPEPIQREMAAFRKALQERYPEEIVMVRPDIASLRFIAYKKFDGDSKWVDCEEFHTIPLGIMLPGYAPPNTVRLSSVSGCSNGSVGAASGNMESECA